MKKGNIMNEQFNKLTMNDFWLVIFALAAVGFMLSFNS